MLISTGFKSVVANSFHQRAFAVTSAGIEGGKNLAESAQDLERTRKAITVQLAEFDGVKKSLMRDLQNRCEKVVELEIQLDDMREQYNNVIRNSNSKAQQKKMAFLERNLEQLTLVQKQVRSFLYNFSPSFRSHVFNLFSSQLVDQNSSLKKEAGIAERKLLARNERIQNLEALLQDADRRLAVQNQKFEAQLQAVKDRLDQARGKLCRDRAPTGRVLTGLNAFPAQKAAASSPLNFGRIAKPLRGGGGGGSNTSAGPSNGPIPIQGGSANPLARLQSEETGSVMQLQLRGILILIGVYFGFPVEVCGESFFFPTRLTAVNLISETGVLVFQLSVRIEICSFSTPAIWIPSCIPLFCCFILPYCIHFAPVYITGFPSIRDPTSIPHFPFSGELRAVGSCLVIAATRVVSQAADMTDEWPHP